MNPSDHQPSVFGVQCDALTRSGKRCRKTNQWEVPCLASYVGSAIQSKFRTVRLCRCHNDLEGRLRERDKRLPLHHGGWLGAYNRYHFGNLVIATPTVNWDTIKSFQVPKFWRKAQ